MFVISVIAWPTRTTCSVNEVFPPPLNRAANLRKSPKGCCKIITPEDEGRKPSIPQHCGQKVCQDAISHFNCNINCKPWEKLQYICNAPHVPHVGRVLVLHRHMGKNVWKSRGCALLHNGAIHAGATHDSGSVVYNRGDWQIYRFTADIHYSVLLTVQYVKNL